MGISMRRYFPAIGTAGFERILVKGCKRVPLPPPIITPSTSFMDGIAYLQIVECDGSSCLPVYCYYLLIFRSCRTFPARNTKGYARIIRKSINTKIKFSLMHCLPLKDELITFFHSMV